jgi:O-antigen ligase
MILIGVPLVPILQLLPLPPALWTLLPGRDIYVETYSAAGMSLPWLPISLAPERTLDSALFTLAPMAGFVLGAIADFRSLRCLSTAIVGMAFLSAIVASLQLVTEPDHWLRFYEISSVGSPVGFFANRNHLGAFMAVCIPITWYWMVNGTGHAQLRKLAAAGLITLFITTAVATQSRASIVLTGLSLSLSLVAFGRRRSFGAYITIIAVGLGLSLLIVSLSEQLIARFARLEELNYRADILPNLLRAVRDVWLTGSGIGTFTRLFPQYETISLLGPVYWNHAHNDWLQVMIEGGIPATLLLIAFLAWWIRIAIMSWSSIGQKSSAAAARAQLRLVTIVTLLLMLHSFVDYPLRTSTLSVIFAFYCGVACRARHVSSL